MAIDHFLDLSAGGITGESSDEKFKNKIEVDSWSVAASNPPDLTSAKGGAADPVVAACAAARTALNAVAAADPMLAESTFFQPYTWGH